ncbi:hypothetical protein L1987_03826 [Smallanthus sonchifolius]|uniref:Uncharacterized protein n=1 Tax=Smallanthus sonchifolius TaxID=185202 RepID=A0ACB9KBQ6_9ASTR|nr:hypothetical protein L1987_03826 [Smallanthus sonchifolius]
MERDLPMSHLRMSYNELMKALTLNSNPTLSSSQRVSLRLKTPPQYSLHLYTSIETADSFNSPFPSFNSKLDDDDHLLRQFQKQMIMIIFSVSFSWV